MSYRVVGSSVNELDIAGELDNIAPKSLALVLIDDNQGLVFSDQFGKYAVVDVAAGTIGEWQILDADIPETDRGECLGRFACCRGNEGQAIVMWAMRDALGTGTKVKATFFTGTTPGTIITLDTIIGGAVGTTDMACATLPPLISGDESGRAILVWGQDSTTVQVAHVSLPGFTVLGTLDTGMVSKFVDAEGVSSDSAIVVARTEYDMSAVKFNWDDTLPSISGPVILGGDNMGKGEAGVARLSASRVVALGGSPTGEVSGYSTIYSVALTSQPGVETSFRFNRQRNFTGAIVGVLSDTCVVLDYENSGRLLLLGVSSGGIRPQGDVPAGSFAKPPLDASVDIAPTLRAPLDEEFENPSVRVVSAFLTDPTDDGIYEDKGDDGIYDFAFGQQGWSSDTALFIFRSHSDVINAGHATITGSMWFSETDGDEIIVQLSGNVSFETITVTHGSTGAPASLGSCTRIIEYFEGGAWQIYASRSDTFAGSGWFKQVIDNGPVGKSYDAIEGWTYTPVPLRIRMTNTRKSALMYVSFTGLRVYYPPAHYLSLSTIDVQLPELIAELYRGGAGELAALGELDFEYVNYGAMVSVEDMTIIGGNTGQVLNVSGDGMYRTVGANHPGGEVKRIVLPSQP